MSADQPVSGSASPAATSPKPASGTSPARLVVLLSIFGLALAGLLYDYCIARPAQAKAYLDIQGLLEETIPDPNGDGTVTDDEVASVLGRQPARTEHLSNGKIEIYSWRSGLPFRTHNLYVVFDGKKMPLLYSASTTRPEKGQLPPETVLAKPMTQEELDNWVPMGPPGAGPTGTFGGRGGRGGEGVSEGPVTVDKSQESEGSATDPEASPPAKTDGDPDESAEDQPATTAGSPPPSDPQNAGSTSEPAKEADPGTSDPDPGTPEK